LTLLPVPADLTTRTNDAFILLKKLKIRAKNFVRPTTLTNFAPGIYHPSNERWHFLNYKSKK
ncbi:MAG: hypothetical protein K2J48_01305, partial [Muribaculaceae bacterium]|nr:hypothetical protein [Muribaculaceae bacterium]